MMVNKAQAFWSLGEWKLYLLIASPLQALPSSPQSGYFVGKTFVGVKCYILVLRTGKLQLKNSNVLKSHKLVAMVGDKYCFAIMAI